MGLCWDVCQFSFGENKMIYVFLTTAFVSSIGLVYYFSMYKRNMALKKAIKVLSKFDSNAIIDQNKFTTIDTETDIFERKLHQAGIEIKEYNQAKMVLYAIGILIGFVLPVVIPLWIGILFAISGAVIIGFAGEIYLKLAKKERVERINDDLGLFLQLVNIILEAGGGIKNAIFQVGTKGDGIICADFLKEVFLLQVEMNSYPMQKAYENFKDRIGSDEVDRVIDFLILSEGTGIGVKEIFARQAEELKKSKSYQLRAKVKVINLYLLVVVFVFILPAIIAFIALPIAAGKLGLGI